MNEKAKYYTPRIEEFHHGFELEELIGDFWEPIRFDNHHGRTDLGEFLEDYRVKYLDQEDIEELGGIKGRGLGDLSGEFWQDYRFGEFCVRISNHTDESGAPKIEIWKPAGTSGLYNVRMFIKNKSELKRIMAQIGIPVNQKQKEEA